VVATGAKEAVLELPGINKKNVVYLWDYLNKNATVGKKVIVIGGNEGAEVAVSLARDGKNVTIVEEGSEVASTEYIYAGGSRREPLMKYLENEKVKILTDTKALEINDAGLKVKVQRPLEKELQLEADTILVAIGRVANDGLADAIGGRGKPYELYCAGDCQKPRSMVAAAQEGHWVARNI